MGRPLEAALYRWEFLDGRPEAVLETLKPFQNPDGGFGHGLESDFLLPDSSPMATSIGLDMLLKLPAGKERDQMIDRAFAYLEEAYQADRGGWYMVSDKVMDYPHTPWWSIRPESGHTAMDQSWGNPSAHILALFLKGGRIPESFDLNKQVLYAVLNLEDREAYTSEHEIYCYLPLYDQLTGQLKNRLGDILDIAIGDLIQVDESKWDNYVPMPTHFLSPDREKDFGIEPDHIQRQLDWLVCKMEKEGGWLPPWGESFYQEGLKKSYHEWIGVLTLRALRWLRDFDRLSKEEGK
jgi:hypothetical protein